MRLTAYDDAERGLSMTYGGPLFPFSDDGMVFLSERFVGYEGYGQIYENYYRDAGSPLAMTVVSFSDWTGFYMKAVNFFWDGKIAISFETTSSYLDFDDLQAGAGLVFSGSDTIYGNKYKDTIDGYAGDDFLRGNGGNDVIKGSDGVDMVIGDAGRDVLYGGSGNDSLYGGTGKDKYFGGAGQDRFVFEKFNESSVRADAADILMDFDRRYDWIALDLLDASVVLPGDNEFLFRGTAKFTRSPDGEVRYEKFDNIGKGNDYTMVYVDNDADVRVEMAIRIKGLVDLRDSDFLL